MIVVYFFAFLVIGMLIGFAIGYCGVLIFLIKRLNEAVLKAQAVLLLHKKNKNKL